MTPSKPSFFSADFFIGNRRRLAAEVGLAGPIVIAANGLLQRGGDSSYSFCQDANFWYLTGIDEPDLLLVIDVDDEYLIVPPRDASRTAFDGAVDDQALTQRSGISLMFETTAGWARLSDRLQTTQQVATVAAAPSYIERYGLYANPARARLVEQLETTVADLKLTDIAISIVRLRMIKQVPELAAIQAAIDITTATIKAVIKPAQLAERQYEYQLEAEISRGFRGRGASGHAFEPIVAGGERACTLHNVANNSAFKADELVVIDVGAEVEHYAADITRTVCRGTPSARARAVHEAVADIQQYAFSILKPGVLLSDYEQQIETYTGQKLIELQLITEISHDAVRHYYPHAASHFLGLNVHDAGDYDLPLAAGMIITVEPGIYISEEGIGVRIEDDVLITGRGISILSKKLPSRLA